MMEIKKLAAISIGLLVSSLFLGSFVNTHSFQDILLALTSIGLLIGAFILGIGTIDLYFE